MCSSLMRRETEEDVSANLTSVLSEENGIEGETRKSELEKKGGRGRKRKELDWKSQQLSLQLQRPGVKHAADKKRMKTIGRVDVPQEAFKLEKEINAAKSAGRAVLSSRLGSSAKTGKSPRILLIGMKFGSLLWIRTSKFHPYCRRETKDCYSAMKPQYVDAMKKFLKHDLSVLDYLSDFVCCLYGKPTAYGVVTLPFSVREGINVFLSGFVPSENLRFRDESLNFKVSDKPQESEGKVKSYAR
ncbi:hypothetical protein Bca52824_073546 [Brassica carinata]|uniref:Uncharacterized protein n=1 Tax=Brassica carinata TaxID=52824 RepID=A0A8X7QAE4_BRACI|nr:hypothetical protein Bca52824_073546 [Brassica carinata]